MLTLPVVSGVQKFQALRADRHRRGDRVGDDRIAIDGRGDRTCPRTPRLDAGGAAHRPAVETAERVSALGGAHPAVDAASSRCCRR